MDIQCPSCSVTFEAAERKDANADSDTTDRCPQCGCIIDHSIAATASMETTDSVPPSFVTELPALNTTFRQSVSDVSQQQLAHFRLIRLLGQGGFGTVWLAQDTNLNRDVALKLPKDADTELLHEAQTAARLKHPNIVSVFEVGVDEGRLFIASEFIDGESLKEELQRGRPQVARTVAVMKKIAFAAHHAHENDIVHRDMKPANVMIDKAGEPFITDFGIAKSVSADETISLDGQIVGTIAYMAPEQAQGQNAATDRRADVYALGVMLFELLTEYRPFRGNAQGILYQKNNEAAPSPRTLVPTLPRDLETICLKCLSRDPDRRYRSARHLAEELERYELSLPILARPISRAEKVWRWARRKPGIAILSTSLLASLIGGLIGVSYFWQDAVRSAEQTEQALYRAHMNLAASAWATSDVDAVRTVLDRYESSPLSHLKDFSFRYLRHATSLVIRTVNHGSPIKALALSYDGSLLATIGHRDGMLRVWDGLSGDLVFDQQNLTYQPVSVVFSPIDHRLLSGNSDGQLRLWNPQHHDAVASTMDHGRSVSVVCFSSDRRLIASASVDGVLRLWKTSTREVIAEIEHPGRPISSVEFSPDGSAVAAVFRSALSLTGRETGYVAIFRTADGEELHRSETLRQLRTLDFTASGEAVVVAADTGNLYEMSRDTGEIRIVRPSSHGTPIGDVTRLADSGHLVVVDGHGHCLRLGSDYRTRFKTYTHNNSFGIVDASQDGAIIAVGSGDGRATILDTRRMQPDNVGWQPAVIRDVAFAGDNNSVAVACADGAVRVWRSLTGEWDVAVPPDPTKRAALSVAVHGQDIAVCGMMRELRLAAIDHGSDAEVSQLPPGGHQVVEWSRDGRLLAVGGRRGNIRVYREGVFDAPAIEIGTDDRINAFSFTSDSTRLAVAGRGIPLRLVNTANGHAVEVPFAPQDEPLCLTFTGNDQTLVIGTQQGFLHFLSGPDLETRFTLKAHGGQINSLAAFPNADQIVTAGQDRRLMIWDVPAKELVTRLWGHERGVLSVTVSPDGTALASSGVEGDVRIWRTTDP